MRPATSLRSPQDSREQALSDDEMEHIYLLPSHQQRERVTCDPLVFVSVLSVCVYSVCCVFLDAL